MKFSKFEISTWTSSFRYPNVISGFQPTLEVPPLSTVLGLLNAAIGNYANYKNFEIGYYFKYKSKFVNKERIYKIEGNKEGYPTLNTTMSVLDREILADCKLYLYFNDEQIKEALRKPYYQLLLGRSTDIATIKYCNEVELQCVQNANKIKGQIIPLIGNYLPGIIQALPQNFTNTIPRQPLGTKPYSVIPYNSTDCNSNLTCYRDCIDGQEVDIYIHQVNYAK